MTGLQTGQFLSKLCNDFEFTAGDTGLNQTQTAKRIVTFSNNGLIMTKKSEGNTYSRLIEAIFSKHFLDGVSEIIFPREEIATTAEELNIELPKNLGDMIYSFRFRRSLPATITATAPTGYEWVLQAQDRSKYKLALVKQSPILILSKQKKSPDVFISYSHKDKEYAHALVEEFERNLLLAWIDDRIDYGAQWPKVIEDHINACPIFVIIMSINAYQSIWVHNELSFAQMKKKVIFPLLLDGETWLSLAAIQYADVRGGKQPPERFFSTIKNSIDLVSSDTNSNTNDLFGGQFGQSSFDPSLSELSGEAKQILIEVSQDPEGRLTVAEIAEDMIITTNGKDLGNFRDARIRAMWKDAVVELVNDGFLRKESKTKYSISTRGYQVADELKAITSSKDTAGITKGGKSKLEQPEIRTDKSKPQEGTINDSWHPTISIEDIENSTISDYPGHWKEQDASAIFRGRLAMSFPGLRGIQKLHGIEAVDRLEVLLSHPLYLNLHHGAGEFDPFWWFRGMASSEIIRFARLAPDRILLGYQEMKVDYIAPVRLFSTDERNLVYVQASAEEPTGLYKYPEGWLEGYLREQLEKQYGYYFSESYGVWKDKLLTVEELEDGATIVDGKPTRIISAEHRERFITSYNFIICGQDNVINNTRADINAEILLNDILVGNKQVADFVRFVQTLPPSSLRQNSF